MLVNCLSSVVLHMNCKQILISVFNHMYIWEKSLYRFVNESPKTKCLFFFGICRQSTLLQIWFNSMILYIQKYTYYPAKCFCYLQPSFFTIHHKDYYLYMVYNHDSWNYFKIHGNMNHFRFHCLLGRYRRNFPLKLIIHVV